MKVLCELSQGEMFNIFPAMKSYGIVVESWEKKNCGRLKRLYIEQFTEKERISANSLYKDCYRWYLVQGLPSSFKFYMSSEGTSKYTLLEKLINFFCTN